jgi:hypothetical protein
MGVRTLPKALLSINKRVIFQLAPSTPKYSNLGHCIAGPHSSIAGITIWGFSISALDLLPAAIANWLSVIIHFSVGTETDKKGPTFPRDRPISKDKGIDH